MKIKFNLITGLISGSGIITIIVIISLLIITGKINEYKQLHDELNNNYQSSLYTLSKLSDTYHEVKDLVNLWVLSPLMNDVIFRKEFDALYENHLYPITRDLIIQSENWDVEDRNLLLEIAGNIRDNLYNEFLGLIEKADSVKSTGSYIEADLLMSVDESNMVFLYSEIEQDLDYLTDKRRVWIDTRSNYLQILYLKIKRIIVISFIILLATTFALFIFMYLNVRGSMEKIQQEVEILTSGNIPPPITVTSDDPSGKVFQRLNKLYNYLHNLVNVIFQIKEKDFTGDFKPLNEKDTVGNALFDLRETLKISHIEEDKGKKEEMERTWVAEGIARINDILRISGDKIEELSYLLIKEIVVYTGSKLGAIYILNDEDPLNFYLEMTAVYAYDRKKHVKKEFRVGEGLVGRCVQEKDTIYMTEVPENYINIKSGLGEIKPVSLLIVPLKLNDDTVYGAVEVASFKEMESYFIRFIETVGENIATTVSKMKINLETRKLLEHTRQQKEELTTQEEEMRQNMEELKAIQEQSAIREEKLRKEIEELRALLNNR